MLVTSIVERVPVLGPVELVLVETRLVIEPGTEDTRLIETDELESVMFC